MKTKILLILVLLCTAFSSCKKDDKETFDYPIETLYGTWEATHIKTEDGEWVSLYWLPKYKLSIKFNSDGTYYGSGTFGNGGGTYKTTGKNITTYIDGEMIAKYTIHSLIGTEMEATMTMNGEDLHLKAKKK